MANFQNALELTLQEMRKQDDSLSCAVYYDGICDDNAIVLFMEYAGYSNMHAVMKDLHKRLSEKMGHPVAVCHNHPTDESVLIHGSPTEARVYYSDECCKKDTIHACLEFLTAREGYRQEVQTVALAAECLAEGLGETPEDILNGVDWDNDPLTQLTQQLIDFHN